MADTLTVPAAHSGEAANPEEKSQKHDEKKVQRQLVSFNFFKVMPEWRRLPIGERTEHKRQFAEVIRKWSQPGRLLPLTYSTVGTRGDCDMVLWRICYSAEDLNQMTADAARRLPRNPAQLPRHDQALAIPHRTRARRPA